MGKKVLWLCSLPWALVGYAFVLLACALGLARHIKWLSFAVLTAEWKPKAATRWQYSTTVGRGIIFQPDADARVHAHEMVHVRQTEDAGLAALFVALLLFVLTHSWLVALLVWVSSEMGFLWFYVAAWLRGGNIYFDAEHERSAFAQTDPWCGGSMSWLELRESETEDTQPGETRP